MDCMAVRVSTLSSWTTERALAHARARLSASTRRKYSRTCVCALAKTDEFTCARMHAYARTCAQRTHRCVCVAMRTRINKGTHKRTSASAWQLA
eukprot:6175555-Pleurochrysis_carterae.AAC.3